MTTVGGLLTVTARVHPRIQMMKTRQGWKRWSKMGRLSLSLSLSLRAMGGAPDKISVKVEESIKNAQDTCSDDPASGECVAAWDEVEELSAAASHAREKAKQVDVLEDYCKDNPETDECRTYDD